MGKWKKNYIKNTEYFEKKEKNQINKYTNKNI